MDVTRVIRKVSYKLRFAIAVLCFLLLGCLVPFLAKPPQALKHISSIKIVDSFDLPSFENKITNYEEVIRNIPFKNFEQNRSTYYVDPNKRYTSSILEGIGNCSNFVFGYAYYLSKKPVEFSIVHIFPNEEFLLGKGHTVLLSKFVQDSISSVGVMDIYQGGIPLSNNQVISLDMIRTGPISNYSFLSLNANFNKPTSYYEEYLVDISVGVIHSEELKAYFSLQEFLSFMPEGRFFKIVLDTSAILTNNLPKVQVLKEDIKKLLGDQYYLLVLYKIGESIFLLLALAIVLYIFSLLLLRLL